MIKFENKNNGRFYYVMVDSDLIHNSVLRVIYGGRHVSRHRTISCNDLSTMQKEIERITKKRLQRGYELVT